MQPIVYDFFSRPQHPGQDFSKETMITQQEMAGEVNINQIIERAERSQASLQGNQEGMVFGDFSSVGTYHEALNQIKEAQENFNQLPANTRAFFQNNPGNLIQFVEDPENTEKAFELGLLSEDATNRRREALKAAQAAQAAAEKAAQAAKQTSTPT